VVNAINNQARKDRMGFTPIELLQMNQPMAELLELKISSIDKKVVKPVLKGKLKILPLRPGGGRQ